MRYNHDEIRDMLPDYLNGRLRKDVSDEIEAHLNGCAECREEMSILSELQRSMDIPDPGDLFWDTLPQKIGRITTGKKKGRPFDWLFRPVPVMVSLLLLITLTFSYIFLRSTDTNEIDPLFEDPLAYSSIEINGITEDDVLALLAQDMEGEDVEIYIEEYDPYSYHIDIASLSSAELQGLYEALQEQTKGG